jgi:ABC-type Mn2+/Zn2+ transport system permease subunit
VEKILSYLVQYKIAVGLSLMYFAAIGYVGLFLILRRASLFGFVLSQVAQVSFLLGLAVAAQSKGHEHVYAMINRSGATGGDWHFLEIDVFVIPITLMILAPFVFFAIRGTRNKETLLVLGLLLFFAAYPLINKGFGGSDALLAKAYFTEILYTPPAMFLHYLPSLLPLVFLLLVFRRQFLLSGFDPIQAQLSGVNPKFFSALFFFLAGFILSFAVRILGIYVSMAALIVPGYVALLMTRRMNHVIFTTLLLSISLPLGGFVFSFRFDYWSTEPLLTVFIILSGGSILLIQKILSRFRLG